MSDFNLYPDLESNYKAIITPVKVRKHPNADRLAIGTCLGMDVVVGIDIEDGQLGVFFDADGQLSEEFCTQHDLIERKDSSGSRAGGFFSAKRRVVAKGFRGVKSQGYWVPLSYFDYTGVDKSVLVQGFEFNNLNGHHICNKYFTPVTRNQRTPTPKTERKNFDIAGDVRKVLTFPKHLTHTHHLNRCVGLIPKGALCHVTSKLHGTSGRYGYIPVQVTHKTKPRVLWNRLVGKYKFTRGLKVSYKTSVQYQHINGTRNVTLVDQGDTYYGPSESFRQAATKGLENRLHKGEIVYFELVGWVNDQKPIMPECNPKDIGNKTLAAQLSNPMYYSYGCKLGECKLYVYRITMNNPDGIVTELPWTAVKARCEELGLKYVPELINSFIYNGDPESLQIHLDQIEEQYGPFDSIDPTHIREGFCLRAEYDSGCHIYKDKTWHFKVLEGIIKEQDTYEDMEEVS